MSFRVRFTPEAKADIERLFRYLAERDHKAAEKALSAMDRGWSFLEEFPFSCRKAMEANPFLREIIISFGDSGYVGLFEIDNDQTVTILAIRHQREDDIY